MKNKFLRTNKSTIIVFVFLTNIITVLFAQQNNIFKVERIINGNAKEFGEKNYLEYHVLQENQKIYSINFELDYDIPFPEFKVFDNGNGVLINAFDASLTFYDTNGTLIIKSNIMKDFEPEYERSIYSAVSDEYLAISLSPNKADYAIVQIYNSQGQFINEWQLQEKYVDGLIYSSKSDLLAISVHYWQNNLINSTIFLNSDGLEISKIPNNFTNGFFVEKENIFIGYTNENCFVYNILENKILHKRKALDNKMILLVNYIDNLMIIIDADKPNLEDGKWFYKNPFCRGFEIRDDFSMNLDVRSKPFSEFEMVKSKSGIKFKTENEEIKIK